MTTLVAVAIGGSVGAPSRYLLDRFIGRRIKSAFPWGTVAINLSGSLLLGILTGLSLASFPTALLETGFCGAYTTFSTFEFETVRLWQEGLTAKAAANLILSVVFGLVLGLVGIKVGLAFNHG